MPKIQTLVQHKVGTALLSTSPDLTATQQLASIPAPVSMPVLGAGPKHVQHEKLAEEDSESTDAGSSESETDMGFGSSASCSDADSDFDSVEQFQHRLERVHRRPRPAPARRLRLKGSVGLVFSGTPLPTIPATPASKTSTWGAEDLASSEDEEDFDRDTSEGREDASCVEHSTLSPAPDCPVLTIGAAEVMLAPPGLLPASMPMFRPPPGLPPPPRVPPRQSTPSTLPVGRLILSTVPPQHFDSFKAPQPKLTSSMVPPSHKAPTVFEADLQKTPPDWYASSLAKSFLPPMHAERVQFMLSTQGIKSNSALTAR